MVTDTHTHGARSMARRTPRVKRRPTVHAQGRLRFVTGLVLIIALATAIFGVEAYKRAARSEQHVAALQAELSSLGQRVADDERAAAGDRLHARSVAARATAAQRSVQRVNWQLQSVPSEAQLAGMRNELAAYAAYATCIPALQTEINGLRLTWRIDADKPATDSFKLFTSAPAPASCSGATSSH
jgi:cell division protein FtsB